MINPPTWVVIQHGGSSVEKYEHSFDTKREALDYIKDAKKHTYDCDGPFEVPGNGSLLLVSWEIGRSQTSLYVRAITKPEYNQLLRLMVKSKKEGKIDKFSIEDVSKDAKTIGESYNDIQKEIDSGR